MSLLLIAAAAAVAPVDVETDPASSDDVTIADKARAAERRLDEEIVVTGQGESYRAEVVQVGAFRNRSVLDTPATVNIVDRALLTDQGARGLDDALRNTPGVTQQTTSPFNTNTFLARGIVIDAQTNYRLNGGLPIINFAPLPIENKERVELLKGASALYYGFATPSGIINLVTKRASDRDVTSFYALGDSVGGYGGGLDVGRRFGEDERLGLRVNALAARTASTTDDVKGNRQLASAALDWNASDRLTARVDVEYYRREGEEPGGITLPTAVAGRITLPPIPSWNKRYAPDGAPFTTWGLNAAARVDYALTQNWTIRAEGGLAEAHRDRMQAVLGAINLTSGAGRLTLTETPDQFWQNRYGRIEAAGTFRTGPLAHELLAGVALTSQYRGPQQQIRYAAVAQNLYDPVRVSLSSLVVASTSSTAKSTVTDTGAYLMDSVSLGTRWQAVLGGRFVNYHTDTSTDDYTVRTVTPTTALIYHPTAQTSLYASYIQGLESAGIAPDGAANEGDTLSPARSRQWEIGARAKLLGLTASVSWFNIDRALAYTNADNVYVVNGRAVHRGVEASMLGGLGDGIEVALAGQYLHAEQKNTGNVNLDGNRVLNTPRWSGSAFVQFAPRSWNGFALNTGAYYTGRRFADAANLASLPGFVTYSLGGAYRLRLESDRTITLRLNADNLTNKRYWATGGTTLYVGSGRTIRASLAFDM